MPGLSRWRWAAFALLVGVLGFMFRGTLGYTTAMFGDPLEDLTHGWVVPFVSAYMVWRQREALGKAAGQPSARGLFWVALSLVLFWFGNRGQQERLEQLSLIGLVWSVPYALWGRQVGRLMRMPAAYLIFVIPVASYLDFFTIHLRILASSLSVALLNGFGLQVEQSGTALISRLPGAEFNIDVADPCSGIRSLFAMMALTAAYAYFTQRTLLQKWALFACSVPLAVAGNIVRILTICLVARGFGQAAAMGFYHDYSGYVVFLAGVGLMLECGRWLGKLDGAVARCERLPAWLRGGAAEARAAEAGPGLAAAFAVPGLALLLAVSVAALKQGVAAPVFGPADFVAASLPQQIAGFRSDVPWYCHNDQCMAIAQERELVDGGQRRGDGFACPKCGAAMHAISLGEVTVLPADTKIVKRDYYAEDGERFSVSLIVAGRRRGSIHRPELCLPAQGFVMLDARRVPVRVAGGFPKMVRTITVQRSGAAPFGLVYWFFCRDRESCSHTQRILSDIWDRSVHNRINRWAMVAMTTSSTLDDPERVARFEAFLSELCGQLKTSK
jgi:exosortase